MDLKKNIFSRNTFFRTDSYNFGRKFKEHIFGSGIILLSSKLEDNLYFDLYFFFRRINHSDCGKLKTSITARKEGHYRGSYF